MNNIADIILSLPASIAVSIESSRRNAQLYPLRKVTHSLQMACYWLRHADAELKAITDSEELTYGEGEENHYQLTIPALPSTPEQLEYLHKSIKEISTSTWDYVEATAMPEPVKYKVLQAYNTIMIALFNTELSITYYGQLTNTREYPAQGGFRSLL